MVELSPGARFRAALAAEKPLQVIGAINANRRQESSFRTAQGRALIRDLRFDRSATND